MEALKSVKAEDRVERSDKPGNGSSYHLDALPGVWLNTNSDSRGIVKVVITDQGSRIMVRVFGAGDLDPCDWGEVEADCIYANNISSHFAAGFTASYRFDFSE